MRDIPLTRSVVDRCFLLFFFRHTSGSTGSGFKLHMQPLSAEVLILQCHVSAWYLYSMLFNAGPSIRAKAGSPPPYSFMVG